MYNIYTCIYTHIHIFHTMVRNTIYIYVFLYNGSASALMQPVSCKVASN